MSFNIRGARDSRDDGLNAWQNRADLNVRTIKDCAPDLIGFQECQPGNLETYQAHLGAYEFSPGPPTSNPDPARHEYNAIFWRPDRFEALRSGGFWLSETPHVWSEAWQTACVRAANWVQLRHLDSGQTFFYLNTHLDHVSKPARQRGLALIVAQLNDLNSEKSPLILSGDFNSNAWNPPQIADTPRADTCHSYLLQQGFVDTYLAAGQRDSEQTYTYHGFKGTACDPMAHHGALRIDWVLARDPHGQIDVSDAQIIRAEEPPLYPSDHYPVLATLRR
jgi:endonuclease/exonuclease/phosphatase family metal-dependent hydrolase